MGAPFLFRLSRGAQCLENVWIHGEGKGPQWDDRGFGSNTDHDWIGEWIQCSLHEREVVDVNG